MTITDEQIESLRRICIGAVIKTDSGREYIFLPGLKVTINHEQKTLDGLLCPSEREGYKTRLFLSETIADRSTINGKPANWSSQVILGRTWYSWSWQGVEATLPLIQMLLAHVGALR